MGRTPLDEWSARHTDLYLTTHNTHNRQTSMPPAVFEPTILASQRPQTQALDRAATVISIASVRRLINTKVHSMYFNHVSYLINLTFDKLLHHYKGACPDSCDTRVAHVSSYRSHPVHNNHERKCYYSAIAINVRKLCNLHEGFHPRCVEHPWSHRAPILKHYYSASINTANIKWTVIVAHA